MKKEKVNFKMGGISRIIGHKSEICDQCGQKVDGIIYKKHLIKKLKKDGLHSLVKLLFKI